MKSIPEKKAELRKTLRSEISVFVSGMQQKQEAENKASSLFLESEFYKNASMVFCFLSCKNEISTDRIIAKCIQDEKPVALPRIIEGTNEMDFYVLSNIPLKSQTEPGSYGILEPKTSLKKIDVRFVPKNAVMLLPGLAFSKDGTRLGKGKGFYDVYLERLLSQSKSFLNTGKKIGYCYKIQLKEDIPCDQNDKKVDLIICEDGIFNIQSD